MSKHQDPKELATELLDRLLASHNVERLTIEHGMEYEVDRSQKFATPKPSGRLTITLVLEPEQTQPETETCHDPDCKLAYGHDDSHDKRRPKRKPEPEEQ